MNPTITQQLQSLKTRMEESVVPELPVEAKFAREQASFIVTTLNWLIETHPHAYRYEVVENVRYRMLIQDMLALECSAESDAELTSRCRAALSEAGPKPDEASIPMNDVLLQNRRLKEAALDLYSQWSSRFGTSKNPARSLLKEVSLKQGRLEVAFFKQTGWVTTNDSLGALLAESPTLKDGEI